MPSDAAAPETPSSAGSDEVAKAIDMSSAGAEKDGKDGKDEMRVAEAAGALGAGGKRRRRPRHKAFAKQEAADLALLEQECARARGERRELLRRSRWRWSSNGS